MSAGPTDPVDVVGPRTGAGDRRLVLDLQATQSAAHGHRGIARYVREHARALVALGRVEQLGLNPNLPFPRRLDHDLLTSPLLAWSTRTTLRAVAARAGGPLAFHLMSPFELSDHAEGDLPAHLLQPGLPLVTTLYDLIPLVSPARYLADPRTARRYRARLTVLEAADLVLCISEHTRRDAIEHLGLDPAAVVTVGAGVSPFFSPPAAGEDPGRLVRRHLPEVRGPFVLTVAGGDPRKNTERLLEAWARVGPAVRRAFQLVVACDVDPGVRAAWVDAAARAGLRPGEVVITGWVPDEVLRALYRATSLFTFPSEYEGYGLPAAEAMACGAPVVTSGTSSLPEVLDWPASTFDPHDVDAVAAAVVRGIEDEGFAAELRARGRERLPALSWAAVADRTVAALDRLPADLAARPLPMPWRVALVGPMPPVASGVADYNARLLPELARRCELDVFSTAPPPDRTGGPTVRWFDVHALGRALSPWSYDAVVYTVGNSEDHHDLYELAEEHPGILWMHDVRLPGLYITYARARVAPGRKRDFLLDRLQRQYRRRLPPTLVPDIMAEPPDYVDAGIGMSRELVGVARGVVVGSEVAARLLRLDQQPDAAATPTWVVAHAVPDPVGREPAGDEAVLVSLGIVAPVKDPDLVIRAFALVAEGRRARLVFVGQVGEEERASLEALARALGVADRVDLTGRCSRAEYDGWLRRATCAVQLRRATNGESSGPVHECIANGIPVVTNVATAGELPPGTVDVVPHDVGPAGLATALRRVLDDPEHVARQRRAQAEHAARWTFAAVADRLLEVVAEVAAAGRSGPAGGPGPAGPAAGGRTLP